jgi:hypothetical protein
MGHFAARLTDMERRSPSPGESQMPSMSAGPSFAPRPPPSCNPYGLPGYGGIPAPPPEPSVLVHSTPASHPIPITQIQFPRSPSAIPQLPPKPHHEPPSADDDDHEPPQTFLPHLRWKR